MKINFEILSNCPLFNGINHVDLNHVLNFLNAKTCVYSKDSPIFWEGSPATFVGLILSGTVQVVREDYYGNRNVLNILKTGELFGEVFPCAGLKIMPVSVSALETSTILLLDFKKLFNPYSDSFAYLNLLTKNLLKEIARKNLDLNKKIRYMSKKTTKEKLMAYLLDMAKENKCSEFTIPHDRQSLADYLGVERSAMSAEISKLRKLGIIDTKGSWFSILYTEEGEIG